MSSTAPPSAPPQSARQGSSPAKRQNLRAQVYGLLRQRIYRGEVQPGERLIDVEIARQMGVSRMPARDALLQLTHEGYLVSTTRGFTLPDLTLDDMREIFEVRRLLEPRAAALAARDRSPQHLAELQQAYEQAAHAQQQHDGEAFIRATIEFRQAWLAAVPNRRLAETLGRFVDHVQSVRFGTLRRTEVREVVLRGLRHLHEAFVNRDSIQAHHRMEQFVMNAEEAYFAASEEKSTPAVGEPPERSQPHAG